MTLATRRCRRWRQCWGAPLPTCRRRRRTSLDFTKSGPRAHLDGEGGLGSAPDAATPRAPPGGSIGAARGSSSSSTTRGTPQPAGRSPCRAESGVWGASRCGALQRCGGAMRRRLVAQRGVQPATRSRHAAIASRKRAGLEPTRRSRRAPTAATTPASASDKRVASFDLTRIAPVFHAGRRRRFYRRSARAEATWHAGCCRWGETDGACHPCLELSAARAFERQASALSSVCSRRA
jgi:hypothetical protein